MATNTVSTLQAGLLSDHRLAFAGLRRESDPKVGLIMDLGKVSDKRKETRAYFDAPQHPSFRPYGAPMNVGDMDSTSWETANYIYDLRLDWSRYDREDDQTQSLRELAQEGGAGFAASPERALFDFITGTPTFLPNVTNAADGLTPFSASTRWETAGGNIVSGQSLTSEQGVINAIYASHRRFGDFKHKGQPLLPDRVKDSPTLVIYSNANNLAVAEAFKLPVRDNSSGNAGKSNILQAQHGGKTYILWESSRMTAGQMVVHLTGSKIKPFFMQTRTPMIEKLWNDSNDPSSKNVGTEGVGWEQRVGFGAGVMYSVAQITA